MPPRNCNGVTEPVNIDDVLYAIDDNNTKIIPLINKCLATTPINDNNDTLLHAASNMGRVEFVKALIAAGAVVNKKNNDGETPLKIAEESRKLFSRVSTHNRNEGYPTDKDMKTTIELLMKVHMGGRRTRNRRTRRTRRGTR